jgi:hypothetical protein
MRWRMQGLWIAGILMACPAVALGQDPVEIHGFGEAAVASRFLANPTISDDFVLTEARFRLDLSHYTDLAELSFKGDLVADDVIDDVVIDIRQAVITLHASSWLDVRAGRQVLTWGTGDLLFLNDLFPKNFVSFFIGRDEEFLKAPSNSVKFSLYPTPVNLDLVWTPVFTPDRYITGVRLSYFDPSVPGLVSAESTGQPLTAVEPAKTLQNGEFAGRLYRTFGGYELALYGYVGFTKRPLAFDPVLDTATFSRLGAYGASVRGTLVGGIGNVEGSYYDSMDDRAGTDPNVPNSQIRSLLGYERELFADFMLGLQYSLQWTLAYEELIANSPYPQFEPDELRHTFTLRSTYRFRQETMTLSLFAFVSPSDADTHLRPSFSYAWSDAVRLDLGANVMAGNESGFFGQLEQNSNIYGRLRYSF